MRCVKRREDSGAGVAAHTEPPLAKRHRHVCPCHFIRVAVLTICRGTEPTDRTGRPRVLHNGLQKLDHREPLLFTSLKDVLDLTVHPGHD